ncbi:MAG: Mur ligase family protein [Candidatus Saccharimonadales bacterium]
MKLLLSLFLPKYPQTLVYMLQSTEYQAKPYLQWFWRTKDFSKVMYRRSLDKTKAAKLLLLAVTLGMLAQVLVGLAVLAVGYFGNKPALTFLALFIIVTYPIVWAYLLVFPLVLGRLAIINPRNRRLVKASGAIFANHTAIKIAVAGSYGKTSMKELLKTVLSEGKAVAATPANKNVAVSHADFARKLTGHEEVLIIEYGEGAPGDVARFAQVTQPNIGIITGLAPAHLDNYPSLQAAGEDIFSLAEYVGDAKTYVNSDSEAAQAFIKPTYNSYNYKTVLDWKIKDIKIDFTGTSFVMEKAKHSFRLKSGLLGAHQVGPLALVAALAHQLGLTKDQIETGVAKTKAFEHRMQPRSLRGAWILDDSYNGNIDGMKAGLKLLQALHGKRKIYVTPGLVDQGVETKSVHLELGRAIAAARPDRVVLMQNSATDYIKAGLEEGNYDGDLQIEPKPLEFYSNLEHILAAGDVIMLQNDWTDNYN